MKVNRKSFLKTLEWVAAGLAQREIIEQSSCFVFRDGRVTTFNDEVSVSAESPIGTINGAVPSKPLLNLLSRLGEEDLKIDQTEQEFRVKGKGRRASIRMEAGIAMDVAVPDPDKWVELDKSFSDAVSIVQTCASRDDSSFVMTCIHVASDRLEACDNAQLAVYPVDTKLSESCLVRRDALVPIVGLKMTEMGVTDSWLHFRNADGLTMSCRRWKEEYPDLSGILAIDNQVDATLPSGLSEAVSKAEVFSADGIDNDQVRIRLEKNELRIRGEGASGWYEEKKALKYDGSPLTFLISPKLLIEITKRTNDCKIAPGRLKIDAGKFVYIACLNEVE